MSNTVSARPISRGLSAREFAELNGCSPETVRRGIRDGTIPSYMVGAVRRIPLSYLEQLQAHDPVETAIQQIVSAAPPLTDDQRNRISALLRTGGDGR